MTRKEAIDKVYGMSGTKEQHEALEFLIPEVRELREFYEKQQEDERIMSGLIRYLESNRDCQPCQDVSFYVEAIAWLKKQKEQRGKIERAPQGDVVTMLLSDSNTSKSDSILSGRAENEAY